MGLCNSITKQSSNKFDEDYLLEMKQADKLFKSGQIIFNLCEYNKQLANDNFQLKKENLRLKRELEDLRKQV
jgi:hypothetical protein